MFADFDYDVILRSLPYLFFDGMTFTLTLTALATIGGIFFGTLLALMRLSGIAPLVLPAAGYVNLMRSVPLVLMIFWFYFLVPYIGQWITGASRPIQVGAFVSSLVTFTLFEAAFFSEIMRAGIQSISRGQVAAAQALGMTYPQTMRYIILPQAFRNMVPCCSPRPSSCFRTPRSCTCSRSQISSAPPRRWHSVTGAWWRCTCLPPRSIS
jgi:glutamate/aspartate transport system permease protein